MFWLESQKTGGEGAGLHTSPLGEFEEPDSRLGAGSRLVMGFLLWYWRGDGKADVYSVPDQSPIILPPEPHTIAEMHMEFVLIVCPKKIVCSLILSRNSTCPYARVSCPYLYWYTLAPYS